MSLRASFILCIAWFVFGCEHVVQVELPNQEPKLVVNSIIHPDTTIWVTVSTTNPVLNNNDIKILKDADISLVEEDGTTYPLDLEVVLTDIFLENERLDTSLVYYTDNSLYPDPGVSYHLEIQVPGFNSVQSGSQQIFRQVPVEVSEIDVLPSDVQNISPNPSEITATIQFEDNPGEENYYQLVVYLKNENSAGNLNDGVEREWDLWPFESNDPALINKFDEQLFDTDRDLTESFQYHAVFDDQSFNGKQKTISFTTSPFILREEDKYIVRIELRHITEELFLYHRSLRENNENVEIANVELPISEPIRIFSNIEGGFGIFGAYRGFSVLYDVQEDMFLEGEAQLYNR